MPEQIKHFFEMMLFFRTLTGDERFDIGNFSDEGKEIKTMSNIIDYYIDQGKKEGLEAGKQIGMQAGKESGKKDGEV